MAAWRALAGTREDDDDEDTGSGFMLWTLLSRLRFGVLADSLHDSSLQIHSHDES